MSDRNSNSSRATTSSAAARCRAMSGPVLTTSRSAMLGERDVVVEILGSDDTAQPGGEGATVPKLT
jgi:hypothetical protein